MLRIGAWCVNPASGHISRDRETVRLEARAMRLLLCLAEHAGEIVSIDELLNQVWPGVIVTPDSVYQAVASLRRLLGDDPKHPTYIATVPRLGYRMVAAVSPWADRSTEDQLVVNATEQEKVETGSSQSSDSEPAVRASGDGVPWSRRLTGMTLAAGTVLCFALVGIFTFLSDDKVADNSAIAAHATASERKSIAVLPFLDLTQGMKEEEFADGMTEELIDRFSKIPGLRVPAPTASFYFKGKQMPLSDIAKTLGVGYVLDGSVRKSGSKWRVAARLFCAHSGYVIWSETYDRPSDDVLGVQDDIAEKVTAALKESIEGESDHGGFQ